MADDPIYFSCKGGFNPDEEVRVVSIEVTDGGEGYSADTEVVITSATGSGAKATATIVGGVITAVIVTSGGRGYQTIPTITFEDDTGTGAEAEATLMGGQEVLENTTVMKEWRYPYYTSGYCEGYHCIGDAVYPDEPDTPPESCFIEPEAIPYCIGGLVTINPCYCTGDQIGDTSGSRAYLENIFTPYDPPKYKDYSLCIKKGFKNVFARKEWHGRYPFINSAPPFQTKYLHGVWTVNYTNNVTIDDHVGIPNPDTEIGGLITVTEHRTDVTTEQYKVTWDVNRFSGYTTVVIELNSRTHVHTYTTEGADTVTDVDESGPASDQMAAFGYVDATFGIINFAGAPDARYFGGDASLSPAEVMAIIAAKAYDITLPPNTGPGIVPYYSPSATQSTSVLTVTTNEVTVADDEIDIKETLTTEERHYYYPYTNQGIPFPVVGVGSLPGWPYGLPSTDPDYANDRTGDLVSVSNGTSTLTVHVDLSNPYSSSDVKEDADHLLNGTGWNLSNDMLYPWRTDVPVKLPEAGFAWAPNAGPAFGPLVSYQQNVPGDPRILGAPTEIGAEPFWDSLRENYTLRFGLLTGYCWTATSTGAASPFPHATQWMSDTTGIAFKSGAHASYNSPFREITICENGNLSCLDGGIYYVSKWAEIYLWDFPAEDTRRPCGPDDVALIDPDTVCDDPPEAQYPDADETCIGPKPLKAGSYTVESYHYDGWDRTSDSCEHRNMEFTMCQPSAIFIQKLAPGAPYEDAVHIAPPSIGEFIEGGPPLAAPNEAFQATTPCGEQEGSSAITQINQAMVDPLWVRPKHCVEDTAVPDAPEDFDVPYVENTVCSGDIQTHLPWSYHVEDDELDGGPLI